MTVNVMLEVGSKVSRQIPGHAIKILECVKQRGRLFVHQLDAHNGAGRPRDIARKLDHSLLNDSGYAHVGEDG